jgi:hypothetical protein
MIKYTLTALCAALLFTSCAGVHVSETQTAAVVTERPRSIYIRPFSVNGAEYVGSQPGGPAARPIRQSLAPAEFSNDLQEEFAKLAPARVLLPGESAKEGWLVDGSLDVVDAGSPTARFFGIPALNPVGKSHIVAHVRISDLGSSYEDSDDKDSSTLRRHGKVIYEFTVAGGSNLSGARGSIYAPGLGYAVPFDFRNAAERIRQTVEPDPLRYGYRSSTTIRY